MENRGAHHVLPIFNTFNLYIMPKHFLSFLAFFFSFFFVQLTWANVITGEAHVPEGYYAGVDGKSSPNAILDALFSRIQGHTVISYKNLELYYEETDFRGDTVWDMYSTCKFTMDDANKSQSAVCDAWNKEHSIPQSWFSEGSPMKSDLFHVYPTDARVNNFRGNDPYGEVNGPRGTGITNKGESGIAPHALGKKGANTFPGYSGTVYEPDDEYKGDFARTYFYMCARYRDKNFTSSGGDAVFTTNKTNLTDYAKNLFLKWHRNDPVSQKEIDRNQAVYGIQKNRNPFIDYPDFAEYIWGERVGQTIDLASMTPTCDGGGSTPVVVIKHGVTWSANGEELQTDSVKENTKPTLPEAPTSCSTESSFFMGWTDAPIAGTQDDVPTPLYTTSADFPVVTTDVTYYAVFAKQEITGGAPATYVFDAEHSTGWTNTAFKSGSYWIIRTGQYLESPSIDLSGLKSVTMTMRSYGGANYNKVNIIADSRTIGTLTAASNSLADQTWTNTATLSGMSPLRFESQNSTDKYGPAFSVVSIDATGAGVSYSRYITSCQSTQEIDILPANEQTPRKMLIDGQLYILWDNKIFNVQGIQIR